MTRKLPALLGFALIVAAGAAWAGEDAKLPTDAPNDAVMAGPAEVQTVLDWATAAFLGGPASTGEKLLIEPVPPFSFRYDGVDSRESLKRWKRSVESKDAADRTQHQVAWTDPKTGLQVTAAATVFKRYPAVEWVLYFENHGSQDTPIIEDIQALDTTLQTGAANQPVILHQLMGDDCIERSFLPIQTALESGKSVSIASRGGRPSQGAFPFFNVEYAGRGAIAAIGWSGQWAASLKRAADGSARLRTGMEKTHLILHPGEKIRSPRILLMPWTGDRLTAHRRFRRLLMFCYVPRLNGRPLRLPFASQCFDRYKGRPDWPSEAGQIAAVKMTRELGLDTHWFDAAWFVGGFPNGVGNWYCGPRKFPNGLKPVSDACHQAGLKFLLWFEPERVAKDTQIAKEHPEFVIGGGSSSNPSGGGESGLFNLGNPAARRWLTDLLSQRITEFGLDVYRNDFNIDPCDFWRRSDAPDRQGMAEIRYVEGHYAMWDELLARHPGLWIDNCSSGGRRIDLETCMRSVPLWRSDTNCSLGHPDWNQTQTQGLSLYLPLFTACTWTPEAYDVRSAATGGLICEFDYLNKKFPKDQAKAAVAEAKENQKFWYGDFYPLTSASLKADQWAAYQFHRADLNAGVVLAFRRGACPKPVLSVKLGGIDAASAYVVEFIDDALHKVRKTIPGRDLAAELELRLPKEGSSLVVRYRSVAPEQLP